MLPARHLAGFFATGAGRLQALAALANHELMAAGVQRRSITSSTGPAHAEPQLARAEEAPSPSAGVGAGATASAGAAAAAAAALPRWQRELGAIRTDWT